MVDDAGEPIALVQYLATALVARKAKRVRFRQINVVGDLVRS